MTYPHYQQNPSDSLNQQLNSNHPDWNHSIKIKFTEVMTESDLVSTPHWTVITKSSFVDNSFNQMKWSNLPHPKNYVETTKEKPKMVIDINYYPQLPDCQLMRDNPVQILIIRDDFKKWTVNFFSLCRITNNEVWGILRNRFL